MTQLPTKVSNTLKKDNNPIRKDNVTEKREEEDLHPNGLIHLCIDYFQEQPMSNEIT